MPELNKLPDHARIVAKALLDTKILRQELSEFNNAPDSQITVNGQTTPLRWYDRSIIGQVGGTEALIFLALTEGERPFRPRVDVKVKRSRMDEEHLLGAFSTVGVHDFKARQDRLDERTGRDAIIESPTHDPIEVADIVDVLPWYITYTTRAILGCKASFRAG